MGGKSVRSAYHFCCLHNCTISEAFNLTFPSILNKVTKKKHCFTILNQFWESYSPEAGGKTCSAAGEDCICWSSSVSMRLAFDSSWEWLDRLSASSLRRFWSVVGEFWLFLLVAGELDWFLAGEVWLFVGEVDFVWSGALPSKLLTSTCDASSWHIRDQVSGGCKNE